MARTSFAKWPCSIARTVDLIGDGWSALILREVLYGARRFEVMQHSLRIGRNILTARLQKLVEADVLERRQYQERPVRYEYHLTEKGRDFFGVLMAMIDWGDRWLEGGRGVPVLMRHQTCGKLTHARVDCAECGEPLQMDEVRAELGPGFPAKLAGLPEVQRRFAKRAATAS